jgi:hypothetical protein
MGRIPETILLILSVAVNGCQDHQAPEDTNTVISHTGIGKNLNPSERVTAYHFLAEKKELIKQAEMLNISLEKKKDSLTKLPLKERDVKDFRTLNIIADKQAFLIKSLNEAETASPHEWDFHHQKLKIIFNDIENFLSEKGTECESE